MLKLKRVQILGFKSFCDRTELQLAGDGIAAIVGPNGCGKSNISDAITWVLGEQSAKSLRGIKMEDVIFAGTRDRKATGMAEVSLTLVDPDLYDGHLPSGEGPELVIHDHHAPDAAPLMPEDWSEEELRRQRADETEEAVAEAQPGVVLEGDAAAGPQPAREPDGDTEVAADSDHPPQEAAARPASDVVLRIRRRRFHRAPVRAGEITVTRRLFRTGDSEYLLNGKICRLRDIQDIFMGTGLGGESYAIIGQERIGQLLSSKPLDRRAILEEAAGITRFKTKKRLAELRLESAKQNLARINDIFDEITRQMGTLKRQAAKAERYGALRDELRTRLRVVLASRMHQMHAEQAAFASQIAALTGEVDHRAEAITREDAEHTAAVQRGYELDEQIRSTQQTASVCAVELERIEARTAGNVDRVAELAERIATATADLHSARQQQAALAHEAEQHRSFLETATGDAMSARRLAETQAAEAQAAVRATAAAETEAEAGRRSTMTLLQRGAQMRNEQAQVEASLAALEREHERLLHESDTAREELGSLGVQRGQVRMSFEGVTERLERLEAEIAAHRLDVEAKRAAESDSRKQGDSLRREIAAAHGRRSSLEGLIRDHSYSTDTVRNLLKAARKGSNPDMAPLGTLADFLEVEGQYGAAVDELLRDELNTVVVRSWEAAESCMALLKADVSGRASFLVRSDAADPSTASSAPVSPSPDALTAIPGVSRVLDSVRFTDEPSRTLAAASPRLRDGFIARDLAQARELAAQFPWAWFVTPEGEAIHDRTITGGRPASGGPLALKRELRDISEHHAKLEAGLAECDIATAVLQREITAISAAMEARTTDRREAEREAANSGAALRQMESETARIERRLGEWQLSSERNRDQRTAAADRIARLAREVEAIEGERATLEATLLGLQETLAGLRLRREELQGAASASAAQLAGLEERRRSAQSTFDQTDRLLRGHTERIAQIEQSIAAAAAEQLRREEETNTLAAQRVEIADRRSAATAETASLTATAADLRARIAALDQHLRTARTEIDAMREHRSELTVRAARLASDIEHLDETCRNDLGSDPEQLRSDTTITLIEGDLLTAEDEQCRSLKQRLENMGPVNMMALEEFTEASERHRFLETQRTDLLDSIQNTQQSIREIDDVSRTKFHEAFTAINQNFAVTFSKLFGGGQAMMKLTDEENAAESGVDIVASPPGKKPQNILLLSGGEKALTALALLVGIFQFQPAPFCVLDEVDAPLDETNVGRFARLIAEMSATTQFVVITHSKRTMQQADVIYGVTMQEPGVSKVVSVSLGERRSESERRRAVA